MKHLTFIAVLAVLLAGCQAGQLVRVPLAGSPDRPPRIDRLVDLGSASVPDRGILDTAESDGLFIAGEWVAVTGTGLNTDRTRLLLEGKEVAVRGGLAGGGLLFRLPGELRFRHSYTVRVETPMGAAESSLLSSQMIVLADQKTGAVLFWRTSSEGKQPFEERPFVLECPGAGPFAAVPGGGLLYIAAKSNRPAQKGRASFDLKVLHLGAKGGAKEIAASGFDAASPPVSLAVAPDGAHAYLAAGGEVVVFDLADPEHPRPAGRLELPAAEGGTKAGYEDLVLLSRGGMAAVLDEPNNRIVLLDLSRPEAPALSAVVAMEQGAARAVGLLADVDDPGLLWVLTGLNAHQVGHRISALWSKKEPDPAPTRTSVIRMDLREGRLVPRDPIDLPQGVLPFELFQEKDGDVLLSAVAYEKEALSRVELSLEGARNLVRGVRDSLFAGRIYRITGDGSVTIDVRSVNLLLSMTKAGDSPLIYSSYRLSTGILSPSLDVVLAVDILKRQSLKVREMSWKAILPPYRFLPDVSLL